jgi:large subunit ribosomal protein L24
MTAIRKGDTVKVIAGKEKGKTGKDKGKTGRVLEVLLEKGRVRVEKVQTVKRHVKKGRSPGNPEGGIVEKDGTVALSNVMVVGADGEGVRREKIARELGSKEKARREKRAAAK